MQSNELDKITALQHRYFYQYMNGELDFDKFINLMSIADTEQSHLIRELSRR